MAQSKFPVEVWMHYGFREAAGWLNFTFCFHLRRLVHELPIFGQNHDLGNSHKTFAEQARAMNSGNETEEQFLFFEIPTSEPVGRKLFRDQLAPFQ